MTVRSMVAGSLARRLSWWLSAQTLAGLMLVSVVVFTAASLNQRTRQAGLLEQRQAVVNHLLREAAFDGDVPALRHKLQDFFQGHGDLRIRMHDGAGQPVFANEFTTSRPTHLRETTYAVPVGPRTAAWRIELALDTSADARELRQLAWTLIASTIIGTFVISIGSVLLVRIGLAPVRSLVRQTQALSAKTLSQRLDGSHQPEELVPLVTQVNELLARLQIAYEQLEAFNANVAHELCTPLTTMMTSTEVMLRRPHASDAYREVLLSNLEELQRLSGIVSDMLFLSRADRGELVRHVTIPSVATLAAEVIEYHEASAAEAEVSLRCIGNAVGQGDPGLLKRALSNLLSNAIRYAPRGTVVHVRVITDHETVSLTVVNRGNEIPSEDLPRLFDRFYRADASRSRSDRHHGLGLAIVSAIARMHGGTTFATSREGITAVGLRWPRSGAGAAT